MIYISHRGNIHQPIPKFENNPDYIQEAITRGYDVEVDVWLINDNFMLGHDKPQYKIDISFLQSDSIWCHCKNQHAISKLNESNIHFFWHDTDQYTLTSKGYVWCHKNSPPVTNSIILLPEQFTHAIPINIKGICSDKIELYRTGALS